MIKFSLKFRTINFVSVFLAICSYVEGYNLSPTPDAIIKDPQLITELPKYRSSYFGLTLNLRKQGIIVGAPRAQSNLILQNGINETGAIYRCPIRSASNCIPYVFEQRDDINTHRNALYYLSEKREYQWLGASMDGGNKDTDKLIVCAPRLLSSTGNAYHMRGICYWIPNTLAELPTNVEPISPLRVVNDQIRTYDDGEGTYHYMFAELGFSAHIAADGEQFVIGAPGISNWRGSVIRYHTDKKILRQILTPNPKFFIKAADSYFGYAVGSGYFDFKNRDRLMYVASAPRGNEQSGEAYIYDYHFPSKIDKHYVCRGLQFGEYFGYAVLAEDINGDGVTDVIISAPQYATDESHDDGAIYVFINLGNFNFDRKLIVSPILGGGRFGTTLTSLGDIDLDGFNDIAVGAPFADGGSVFIYMGSKRGLRDKPSQRLDYPKSMESEYRSAPMFGHGLSKGSDIDDNGYNDFAIGAPNAETVFVYRTYPVVSIEATIAVESREIPPTQSSFQVTVCYQISTNSPKIKTQDLFLRVIMDPQFKRIAIDSTSSHYIQLNVTASTEKQCRNLNCEVSFRHADVYKPMPLELNYHLINGIPQSGGFCEHCAALDPAQPTKHTEKIIFNTGCKSEMCVADLKVTSYLNHTYVLGSSQVISVTYEISNRGETAYLPQLSVSSSNHMTFAKIPPNCKFNIKDSSMLCDLNRGQQMDDGMTDSLEIAYDASSISGEIIHLFAKVFSTGKELNLGDNEVSDTITLKEFAEIYAVGESKTSNVNLEDPNEAEIVNVYNIKSSGPSTISAVQIVFDIPVNYTIAGTTQSLSIVDDKSISMRAIYDSQMKDVLFFQNNTQIFLSDDEGDEYVNEEGISEGSNDTSSTFESRSRRDAVLSKLAEAESNSMTNSQNDDSLSDDLKGTLPLNRTIVVSCNNTAAVQCVRAVITLYDFKPEMPLDVAMKYEVNMKAIANVLNKHWEFLVLQVAADVRSLNNASSSTLVVTRKIQNNIVSKHQLYGTPTWIYILGALGGLLVLVIITYILYKIGFFKRTKREEMERLILHAKLTKHVDNEECALYEE
ncbi:integrin alpha-PS3-like [Haematobia irritans]|uniref:integrin alpha-PS3-like n=1 Tax=Haematobia irritans TaxID=7368 RepID=UPI003F5094F4